MGRPVRPSHPVSCFFALPFPCPRTHSPRFCTPRQRVFRCLPTRRLTCATPFHSDREEGATRNDDLTEKLNGILEKVESIHETQLASKTNKKGGKKSKEAVESIKTLVTLLNTLNDEVAALPTPLVTVFLVARFSLSVSSPLLFPLD